MEQNIELPGIVTEDHQLFREPVMQNAAEQRALRGDLDMTIFCDAQLLQMLLPVCRSGKMSGGVFGETCEQRLRETLPLYVRKSILTDYVISMPIAQQLQEVNPAFAPGALEPGEELIAYMSAVPVLARMPCAGIVHIDVVGYLQAGS